MAGNNESIINLKHLSPNTLMSDIVYIPYKTPILRKQSARETIFIMA